MSRRPIATELAPSAIGPYSQAIRQGRWLYCSGQVGLDPATGRLVSGGLVAEARRALTNLQAVIEAGGASLASVVKTTVYLTDLGQFQRFNEVYAEFFRDRPPARATVGVAALPAGAVVEIDAVARCTE